MSLLRGKAPYRDHLLCRTEDDLYGLSIKHREAAFALVASSEWPRFDQIVVACVDEELDKVVGVTSARGEELLFLVVSGRQGEGIGQLMAEALAGELPEVLTEEEAASESYVPPWSAIAGSEAGVSFLASLPQKLGWKVFALIEWSGYDEEKTLWREYLAEQPSTPRELPPLEANEVLVYRWTDGSQAVLLVEDEVKLEVRWVHLPTNWVDPMTQTDTFPAFFLDSPYPTESRRNLMFSGVLRFPAELERKVLGLFLDLGVDRPCAQPSLVSYQWGPHAVGQYPRFVPDERWEGRYEEAKKTCRQMERDRLLGVVVGFRLLLGQIQTTPPSFDRLSVRNVVDRRGWTAEWSGPDQECSAFSMDLEEVVDEVLRRELVLPESQREAWERDHVERGEFVAPTPEEVAVYDMLGEDLPIWWDDEPLLAWMRERSS